MQLFYTNQINIHDNQFTFSKEESKHIIKVLRKKEQDKIFITNGLGYLFETSIKIASDSRCTVSIVEHTQQSEPEVHLHLAVAPTKMNDRYEWFLEKATEIGIQEITPIICDQSERKVINIERFEKILVSAMKQSNQLFLPKINEPISFQQFVSKNFEGQKFIAHCTEDDKKSLKNSLVQNQDVLILIGPEGDFSAKEIQQALHQNYTPVSLGNTRLRTETAAVVACHTVQLLNEK